MSNSKKCFCVLEQGDSVGDPITEEHKLQFNGEHSDFYRLNWKRSDDPNSFLSHSGITWSEGRSLLYEKVPKNYEYYILIDDDMRFRNRSGDTNVAAEIASFLEEYRPLSATFYSENWHNLEAKVVFEQNPRKAFPYAGQDLEVMVFSKSYANHVFPVYFHGCWGSMWYANYICHQLYPMKQICYSGIIQSNNNHSPNEKLNQHFSIQSVIDRFNGLLLNPKFPSTKEAYQQWVKRLNYELFLTGDISKDPVEFTLEKLSKIVKVTHPDFLERHSQITTGK